MSISTLSQVTEALVKKGYQKTSLATEDNELSEATKKITWVHHLKEDIVPENPSDEPYDGDVVVIIGPVDECWSIVIFAESHLEGGSIRYWAVRVFDSPNIIELPKFPTLEKAVDLARLIESIFTAED